MDEIEPLALVVAEKPRARSGPVADEVPLHLRAALAWRDGTDHALQQPEPSDARVFLRALEQQLQADTDAEKRDLVCDTTSHDRVEPRAPKCVGTSTEGTDARQHDAGRARCRTGLIDQAGISSDVLQGFFGRTEVAYAVVEDSYHRPAYKLPLVEGMAVPSIELRR